MRKPVRSTVQYFDYRYMTYIAKGGLSCNTGDLQLQKKESKEEGRKMEE